MIIPLLLGQLSDPAVRAISNGVAAIVAYEATEPKRRIRSTYYVFADRSGVSIRQVQPPQNGMDRTDTIYWLGTELRALDQVNHEWLSRKLPPKESPLVTLVTAVGLPVEPLATTLDPARLTTFLKRLQDPTAGLLKKSGNQWRWHGGSLQVDVSFEPTTHRVRQVTVVNPKSKAKWAIQYGPLRPVPELRRPNGADLVKTFVIGPALPQSADSQTESLLRTMLKANCRLDNTEITIENDATLLIGSQALGEQQGNRKWLYSAGVLTYRDGGLVQTFPTRRSDLLDKLASLNWPIHPLLREYLTRRALFANAMLPGGKARTVGTFKVKGQDVRVVDINGPLGSISLGIRTDGLVISQSSTVKDRSGNTLSSTDQLFTYRRPARLSEFR